MKGQALGTEASGQKCDDAWWLRSCYASVFALPCATVTILEARYEKGVFGRLESRLWQRMMDSVRFLEGWRKWMSRYEPDAHGQERLSCLRYFSEITLYLLSRPN